VLQQLFLRIERVLNIGQRTDPLDDLAGFVTHGHAAGLEGPPCLVLGAPDSPLGSIDRVARPHGTYPIGRHLRSVIRVNGQNPLRVLIFFPGLAGVLLPARLTLYKFAFRARDPDDSGGSEKNGVVTSIAVRSSAQAHQGSFRSPHSVGCSSKNAIPRVRRTSTHANSSSNAFAFFKSWVSNPSVNES
jgi:hypothetical protein